MLPHPARPMFQLNFEPDFVDAFTAGARDILCSGRPLSENQFTRTGTSLCKCDAVLGKEEF